MSHDSNTELKVPRLVKCYIFAFVKKLKEKTKTNE